MPERVGLAFQGVMSEIRAWLDRRQEKLAQKVREAEQQQALILNAVSVALEAPGRGKDSIEGRNRDIEARNRALFLARHA